MDGPARSLRIPDAIEPILAYRAWRCDLNGLEPVLSSLGGTSCAWDAAAGAWIQASCPIVGWVREEARAAAQARGAELPPLPAPHDAPGERCSCGFYALQHPEDVVARFGRVTRLVLGRVRLAGKVIVHDMGYRAQRARIDALLPTSWNETLTALVALRWQIPIDRSFVLHLDPEPEAA
jgi:hypothetical protein